MATKRKQAEVDEIEEKEVKKRASKKDEEEESDENEVEDDDDDGDEAVEYDEEDEEEEEGDDDDDEDGVDEEHIGEENGGDEDGDEDDEDVIKIECVEAVLEAPKKEDEGNILKKTTKTNQMLELFFAEEMLETLGEVRGAFCGPFDEGDIPILKVKKFDIIQDTPELLQIDVTEVDFNEDPLSKKEMDEDEENENPDVLDEFYAIVRVDGMDKMWATQEFMPDPDE